jgi:lysozyme family protein
MNVDTLIEELIAREGGYIAHPADRGGATRYGITAAVARGAGYAGDMRRLPIDLARAIYRARYWHGPGFDRVAARAPLVAAELFDTGVNMGPAVAAALLRRALNALNRGARDYPDVGTEGMVDAPLLGALDGFLHHRGKAGEHVLVTALDALQGERYVRLAEARPANETFLYGWLAGRVGSR